MYKARIFYKRFHLQGMGHQAVDDFEAEGIGVGVVGPKGEIRFSEIQGLQ